VFHFVVVCSQPLIVVVAQEERQYAIKSFKSGAKDVMVASGVASKGLDFNDIQHVIIFSMPKEIEDYVHQIGRTGRSGKTGIATTFVNMNTPEQTLLDLKYLLMEAGQKCVSADRRCRCPRPDGVFRVPPFLQTIEDPRAAQGGSLKGCPVCGGTVFFLILGGRKKKTYAFLPQVLGMAFPTVQSSRILSGDRWLPTALRKIQADIERPFPRSLYALFM
jgi:Helicase conserved C-terminal domain